MQLKRETFILVVFWQQTTVTLKQSHYIEKQDLGREMSAGRKAEDDCVIRSRAAEEPLNGPCGDTVLSTAVSKVKNERMF